jgi:ABC-type lipoprotein export system ATPase subunit
LFQFFNLLQGFTARETAMMLAGIPEKRQAARARGLLSLVGIVRTKRGQSSFDCPRLLPGTS